MKILQVTPYFSPAWAYGGLPRSVSELCSALAKRNHSVTVLTTDALSPQGRISPAVEKNDVEVLYQRNLSNYLVWRHQLLLPIGIRSFLRKRLREFDVVHVHGFRMLQSVIVHRFARRMRVPYVVSTHGGLPRIVRRIPEKLVFDKWFGERFLQDARRVTALSKAEKVQYELFGIPSSRIRLIYNGLDATKYATLPSRGLFVRKIGLQDRTIITYIGRLNVRKGIDVLLRSFCSLAERRKDIALLLVGEDDGYRRTLERLIAELSPTAPVVFTGLVTLPEKLGVLVDSRVVVYPSQHEFFGLVPFEALLCNVPIVVTNDSGCGEIVEDARAGRTVNFGDEVALATAIDQTLNDDPETVRMTERGRRFVLDQMSWERVAAQVEETYEEAVEA